MAAAMTPEHHGQGGQVRMKPLAIMPAVMVIALIVMMMFVVMMFVVVVMAKMPGMMPAALVLGPAFIQLEGFAYTDVEFAHY